MMDSFLLSMLWHRRTKTPQQLCCDTLLAVASSLLQVFCVLGCLSPCYLLILGKPSSCPRIYVGCGTHTARGVVSRLQDYDAKTNIPRYVQQAFDDSYTITHKGLLCWASIPDVTIRFPVRVLFVLLEVIFALMFWAMISQTKDYGMPRLSPWNAKDIAWDGCCSHSALLESVTGRTKALLLSKSLPS